MDNIPEIELFVEDLTNRPKTPPKSTFIGEVFAWVEAFALGICLVVIINTFVICTSNVIGISMEPTLMDNDRLLVNRFSYNEPARGDVVILYSFGYWDKLLVKRVIAVEGDVIDIEQATGNVYVNGEYLDEPYIAERIRNPADITFPFTVPEDTVFVMGDNRNFSTDSRYVTVGPVNKANILGKAIWRIWPLSSFGSIS